MLYFIQRLAEVSSGFGRSLSIYYSVSHRGNEDDYTRQWHQECSSDHPEWKKYFIEIEKQKVRRLQERMKNKKEAVKHIYLADDIDIEEVDGEIVITCTTFDRSEK